ncbi:hypothetical protein Tco_0210177 [Tanacetum coccineum]
MSPGYGVLEFISLWFLVKYRHRYAVSSLMDTAYRMLEHYHPSVRCAPFEALYGRKCHSPILWAEFGEGKLIRSEIVQETTEKNSQINDRLKAARDCVVCLGKKGKLAHSVHDTFHVLNLKKCLADPTLYIPLEEIQVDAKLNFVEEPVEILEREIKKLKRSRISIVKVRWNSKRGPEFTWEREDQMKLNYHSSVRCAPFEALYGRKCRSPILWAEVGEGKLIRSEIVQETTEKNSQIKDRLKAARDRVVCLAKKGKLAHSVHDTFHVSNLKKCLADPTLYIPLEEIQVDAKLNFVEEPVEILEREIKKLKRSRISIVKVRWNSKRGPEFTWEREDQMKLNYHSSVRCAPFEALYGIKCRSPILWAEVGEEKLIRSEIVQETTEKNSQIKDRLKAARNRVVCFGKKGKLAHRFVGPFEITERIGSVAYRLILPQELSSVHDTFHVLNLKKCLADPTLYIPLEEIQVDAKLNFVEEHVEILEREIKKLKRSRISIIKVRWNSKRGPEFTWEREDQMKLKYPHLFSSSTSLILG